jgi:conjugative transfer signal peptidase TraF
MRKTLCLVGTALGVTALVLSAIPQRLRLVYNASASAPLGWYSTHAVSSLSPGDFVVADLPPAVAEFAEQRGYLPHTVPILKHVGALAGQHVCTRNRVVSIDGRALGRALETDGAHRALPVWNHCRALTADEVFLFSTEPEGAFDSRYFGPVSRASVRVIAQPLWTWSER